MGFKNQSGFSIINNEQKVRIGLSKRAEMIMAEDMIAFSVDKKAQFINTVFDNFKLTAKSSVSIYLEEKKIEYEQLFADTPLDEDSRQNAVEKLLSFERDNILAEIEHFMSEKAKSKIYHINNANTDYLTNECNEEIYYNQKPAKYLRSIIEEYCSLPFIKREKIYRKPVFDQVQNAIKDKRILKVQAKLYNKEQIFYVYPYKIISDSSHSQYYLACYSTMDQKIDPIIASFSMARLNIKYTMQKNFHLSRIKVNNIDKALSMNSASYLISKPEQIRLKLTKKGYQTYLTKLFSRPELSSEDKKNNIYTFSCSPLQAYNYFFSFGREVEILEPESLRNKFIKGYSHAFNVYRDKDNSKNS